MPVCSVSECGRATVARGLCTRHYQRLKNHGSPHVKLTLKGEPVTDRFWLRVERGAECWIWTGAKTEDGYGRLWGIDKEARAHRLSYEMNVGPIPDGLDVLHRCDTPACVRPEHLFVGTQLDNARDMHAKGRANLPARSGEHHWTKRKPDRVARGSGKTKSHLTEALVAEIRSRYARGGMSQREMARQYQLGYKNLNLILNNRTWTHAQQGTP